MYKNKNRTAEHTLNIGSILNAFREKDITFEEAKLELIRCFNLMYKNMNRKFLLDYIDSTKVSQKLIDIAMEEV